MATTDSTTNPTFFERNKKAIMIASLVLVAILLLTPDIYIRKYVPWVK
jgi:accessory gene regulator protein AgrB